ncbi:MAG: radical SAM protein [Candidatus Firestonebacteria bacterium]
MQASYIQLLKLKELESRVQIAYDVLKDCTLCPRNCRVNRVGGELGFCKSGNKVFISDAIPHFGEEPFISGKNGSGTIFFSNCNLRCKFCQNYQISHEGLGKYISEEELAKLMISLQKKGCHNINLVSPTHYVPQILKSLLLAANEGLNIPIVYNTNAYDSVEVLKILNGIVDIYMPDIKYSNDETGFFLSNVQDYLEHNRNAILEMYRQVGNLKVNKQGIAERGILIRHLVLPNKLAGSIDALRFLKKNLGKEVYISLMAQYHPCYKAKSDARINRCITNEEYQEILDIASELDLENVLIQELTSHNVFLPDFTDKKPFKQNPSAHSI